MRHPALDAGARLDGTARLNGMTWMAGTARLDGECRSPREHGGASCIVSFRSQRKLWPADRRCSYCQLMDVIELAPRLHLLRFAVGNAYLWQDADGLTLIDSGVAGSGPLIAEAIRGLGHQPGDLRRLVLTHFHGDHVGAAAEIAGWGDVVVSAHHADAPVIAGRSAGPLPDLADWERPLFDRVSEQMPGSGPAPVPVDRELGDGDELEIGGGALAVAVPGHTPGSVALYLPGPRVLFTGDAVARGREGGVIPGVFNADRQQAAASVRLLAGLDAQIACFGHGEPVTAGAAAQLRAAADRLPA